MWEAKMICESCHGAHVVCSPMGNKPRVFAYDCPVTGERMEVRYRDPSRFAINWHEVSRSTHGAVVASSSASRGAFEL